MDFENLTPEQQEKLKAAKTLEEIGDIANEEGFDLPEDQLDAVAGGHYCSDYAFCRLDSHCHNLKLEPGPPIV